MYNDLLRKYAEAGYADYGLSGATIGGGLGSLLGGMVGYSQEEDLAGTLGGALIGAGVGGLAGGLSGLKTHFLQNLLFNGEISPHTAALTEGASGGLGGLASGGASGNLAAALGMGAAGASGGFMMGGLEGLLADKYAASGYDMLAKYAGLFSSEPGYGEYAASGATLNTPLWALGGAALGAGMGAVSHGSAAGLGLAGGLLGGAFGAGTGALNGILTRGVQEGLGYDVNPLTAAGVGAGLTGLASLVATRNLPISLALAAAGGIGGAATGGLAEAYN